MIPDINLLPKYNRQDSVAYIVFSIGFILAFLVLIGLIVYYFYLRGALEDTSDRLAQVQQERDVLAARVAELEQDNSDSFLDVYTYIDQQVTPTSFLIDELVNTLPVHSYLYQFDYADQTAEVDIQFETMSDTAAYVEELIKSDFIKNATVDEMNSHELEFSDESEEQDPDDFYHTIPRYQVRYTVEVDHAYLKEAGNSNEEVGNSNE